MHPVNTMVMAMVMVVIVMERGGVAKDGDGKSPSCFDGKSSTKIWWWKKLKLFWWKEPQQKMVMERAPAVFMERSPVKDCDGKSSSKRCWWKELQQKIVMERAPAVLMERAPAADASAVLMERCSSTAVQINYSTLPTSDWYCSIWILIISYINRLSQIVQGPKSSCLYHSFEPIHGIQLGISIYIFKISFLFVNHRSDKAWVWLSSTINCLCDRPWDDAKVKSWKLFLLAAFSSMRLTFLSTAFKLWTNFLKMSWSYTFTHMHDI